MVLVIPRPAGYSEAFSELLYFFIPCLSSAAIAAEMIGQASDQDRPYIPWNESTKDFPAPTSW